MCKCNSACLFFAISMVSFATLRSNAIAGDASFEVLNLSPSQHFIYDSFVGGDGRNAMAWSYDHTTQENEPLLISACGAIQNLNDRFSDGAEIVAVQMAADGQTLAAVVHFDTPPSQRLFVLPTAGGAEQIDLPAYVNQVGVYGVSANGTTLLIAFNNGLHLWSQVDGLNPVRINGQIANGDAVLSPDGSTVAINTVKEHETSSHLNADAVYLWRSNDDGVWIENPLPFPTLGGIRAIAVANSGDYVIGNAHGEPLYAKAFRWSPLNGIEFYTDPTATGDVSAHAVGKDGEMVLGECNCGNPIASSFILDSSNGLRSLSDALSNEYGLDDELDGWVLGRMWAASADGNVLYGNASYSNDNLNSLVRIVLDIDELPANSDTDADGVCDTDDFCAGDDATGDYNGDGVCDDLDPEPVIQPQPEENNSGAAFELTGCPEDISVVAASPDGNVVDFPMPRLKAVNSRVKLTASRASGSMFPIGSTPVTIVVVVPTGDSDGAVTEEVCSFTVEVRPGDVQPIDPREDGPAAVLSLPSTCGVWGVEGALLLPMMLVYSRRRR